MRRETMKNIVSIILSALLICSAAACSADTGVTANSNTASDTSAASDNGTENDPATDQETDSVIDIEELPSKVDLRDYNGKNYVTPVKRQAFGDCWSFGIAAAAESSYLYENDLGIPAEDGTDNDKINFSERYLSWFVFHSITEDDVKPGKVRASQVGEGYDVTEAESKNPNAAFMFGGALFSETNMFASGFGPVDEMTEVNGEYPYAYSDNNVVNPEDYEDYSSSGDWSIPINAQYRNPPLKALLRNGNILPCPASRDENGNYIFSEEGLLAIKSELADGHAVAISALVFGRMNRENWAAYTPDDNANHVITIIGYDDNFPKENFAVSGKDGEPDPDSIPPTDGAFIIKDSYGEIGGFDAKGSYYISYHDQTLRDPISFDFDKADSVKYTDLNYDQYDMLMVGWCAGFDYDNESKMANVFDAEEDEYLYQISYRTKKFNTSVHYAIYKDATDGSPDKGTLLEEGDNSHSYAGSHTIDLKNEYSLKKGDKYSIVLTMTYKTDKGTEVYTDVIPYATDLKGKVSVKSVVNKGESYLFTDGKWTDITELTAKFAEQAFGENAALRVAPDFKATDKDGIAIDNYPIKAILVPADKH